MQVGNLRTWEHKTWKYAVFLFKFPPSKDMERIHDREVILKDWPKKWYDTDTIHDVQI